MIRKCLFVFSILFSVSLAACAGATEPPLTDTPEETSVPSDTSTPQPPTASPTTPVKMTPTNTPTPIPTATVIYPPEPRQVTFESQDGQVLTGTYYPSDESPAPVIVLMHGAIGDEGEWSVIARWLQNRGLLEGVNDGGDLWLSPGWFPDMLDSLSPAVFTFTFRDCQGGCKSYPTAEWLLDAQAAMEAASMLEGVDKNRVVAVGVSIGADGAVDGCRYMNESLPGTCLGAFALSPGSYLTVPYEEAAQALLNDEPPRAVWCLFTNRDDAALETCPTVSDANNIDYGNIDLHGFELIMPDLDPSPLNLLLEFLESSFQEVQ